MLRHRALVSLPFCFTAPGRLRRLRPRFVSPGVPHYVAHARLSMEKQGCGAVLGVCVCVGKIQSAVLQSSSTAMCVVVPPNQVPYGLGRLPKTDRGAKVAAHQVMWKAEFESLESLSIQKATVLFDQEAIHSDFSLAVL